tara:strand:+ start:176 stop:526 length:351 start_codon:yes stop_codon:yes gene_type:complete
MRKIIPLLKIVAILSAVGWCIQNYSKNGFRDLTDFIIPLILILYFLYDFYSSRKKKLEKPKESDLREEKAFNLFCYTFIIGSLVFQYFNNRLDWGDLILPSIILATILFPKLKRYI